MTAKRASRLTLAAGLAALSSVAACSTLPEGAELPTGPTLADRHAITIVRTGETMNLQVAQTDNSLSYEAQAELTAFAHSYSRWGEGSLVMSMPSGGANADAVARLAQQARMVLADNGVPYLAISSALYDASGRDDAPIMLNFSRFAAQGPDCAPLWTQDLARPNGGTGTYDSFGCATVSNLAAMLENPRDYEQPRDEDPRDAARRAVVLGHYREGQQTHAVRTQDERVTISTAIQ